MTTLSAEAVCDMKKLITRKRLVILLAIFVLIQAITIWLTYTVAPIELTVWVYRKTVFAVMKNLYVTHHTPAMKQAIISVSHIFWTFVAMMYKEQDEFKILLPIGLVYRLYMVKKFLNYF
jgi:hypothetical protein